MFIFIFANLYVVVGKETKNYNYCTDDEVKKASLIHITNVVYSAKENHEISNWSNGVNLKNIKDVYDPFGNVIMCIYELCDLHNNDAGYILLSKVKNYYAILSYQETESHFYHLANKIIEKNMMLTLKIVK